MFLFAFNLFVFLSVVTPSLVVAIQPWMECIPIYTYTNICSKLWNINVLNLMVNLLKSTIGASTWCHFCLVSYGDLNTFNATSSTLIWCLFFQTLLAGFTCREKWKKSEIFFCLNKIIHYLVLEPGTFFRLFIF